MRSACRWMVVVALLPGIVSAEAVVSEPQGLSGLLLLRDVEKELVDLTERLGQTVVAIEGQRPTPWSDDSGEAEVEPAVMAPVRGSGLVISSNGEILTNEHVVRQCTDIRVTLWDGRTYAAQLVAGDPRSDLAVLKIAAADLPTAKFGDIGKIRRGQWALAMGNPLGLCFDGQAAVSLGIVSSIGRYVPGVDSQTDRYYGNLIQTTAQINVGNSGGPLFNLDGEVIGINTIISATEVVGGPAAFAIPACKWTKRIIEKLRAGERIDHGYLGLSLSNPAGKAGARVETVKGRSPAALAGIEVGDLIVEYDDEEVANVDDLIRLIGLTVPGTKVSIKLERDARLLQATLVVAARRDFVHAAHSPAESATAVGSYNYRD